MIEERLQAIEANITRDRDYCGPYVDEMVVEIRRCWAEIAQLKNYIECLIETYSTPKERPMTEPGVWTPPQDRDVPARSKKIPVGDHIKAVVAQIREIEATASSAPHSIEHLLAELDHVAEKMSEQDAIPDRKEPHHATTGTREVEKSEMPHIRPEAKPHR